MSLCSCIDSQHLFSSPLLICAYVYCICDSFNHYGAKRPKIKYFYECSNSKIKLPLIHIFHPHYYYLQTCNFLNWKNSFMEFCPKCASHFRKDFFSLDLKKSTYSTHILYTVDFLTIHLNWLYSKMHYSLQFESNNNLYTIHMLT